MKLSKSIFSIFLLGYSSNANSSDGYTYLSCEYNETITDPYYDEFKGVDNFAFNEKNGSVFRYSDTQKRYKNQCRGEFVDEYGNKVSLKCEINSESIRVIWFVNVQENFMNKSSSSKYVNMVYDISRISGDYMFHGEMRDGESYSRTVGNGICNIGPKIADESGIKKF